MTKHFYRTAVVLFAVINVVLANENSYESVSIGNYNIKFSLSGDIYSLHVSYPQKNAPPKTAHFYGIQGKPLIELKTSENTFIDSCMRTAGVIFSKTDNDSAVIISFRSNILKSNTYLEKIYTFRKTNYLSNISIKFSGDYTHNLQKEFTLVVNCSENEHDKYHYVSINKRKNRVSNIKPDTKDTLTDFMWGGKRDRFWTMLFTTGSSSPAYFGKDQLSINLKSDDKNGYTVSMYSGPIVFKELQAAGSECSRLLYPLWFWMRWLSIGLLIIFNKLLELTNNVVVSLVLLSITVKIIISPFFRIANKWQEQVNRQTSILQPRLTEIKTKYKGEEQTKQTLALYKELGISPLYSLKSLLSAAIQIPIFFAAYHMLSEHIALSGISFLWIADLSHSDNFLQLPFTLPYFGNHLNILPFVMTSVTIASSWLHKDHSLSAALQRKQQTNLYFMAGLFFILLYTSPAGMVIYWTMNNILAFLSTLFEQKFSKKQILKTI